MIAILDRKTRKPVQEDVTSRAVELKAKPGSIWLRRDLPEEVNSEMGDECKLEVEAVSLGELTYRWMKDGNPLAGMCLCAMEFS